MSLGPIKNAQLQITRGDSYTKTLVPPAALLFTDILQSWPDLTNAAIIFLCVPNSPGALPGFQATGSVVTPTGNAKVIDVELTSAETANLTPGRNMYQFEISAQYPSGDRRSLVQGVMHVDPDIAFTP